jgi:transmembrane sensor
MTESESYKLLVSRYLNNQATGEEQEVFFHLLEEGKLDSIINEALTGEFEKALAVPKVIPLIRRPWFRLAAATVLLLIVAGSFFLFNSQEKQQQAADNKPAVNDLPPGGNKAVLTLSDGSKIILDSAANGNLSNQGNATVIKIDNQVLYKTAGKSGEVIYNTISTPKGGTYQLVLADGTRVWLNAASSLRFPVAFVGRERRVEITGEAYMEVTKNAVIPFIVDVAHQAEIEVLGTHFNVNSYADESAIKTTLVEGRVKVTGSGTKQSQLLLPGQQARIVTGGQISIERNVDMEEVLAWKNGKFEFGDAADIASVMRQISRWYDVEVEYKGTVTGHIGGSISRNVSVSKVFEMLEMTGSVKFGVSGKKVTVMPH